MIEDNQRHSSLVDSVYNQNHKKEHKQESQVNLMSSNHSNSTASLFQEQQTFSQCWQNIINNQFFQSKRQRYLEAEKQYHKNGIQQKIVENTINSLRSLSSSNSNTKKKQQPQQSLVSYIVFSVWIPYIKEKLQTWIYFNTSQWITNLQNRFEELIPILIHFIQRYYPIGEQNIRYNYTWPLYIKLFNQITSSEKWIPINDIILKIVSRYSIPLQKNPNIKPQIFNLTDKIVEPVARTELLFKSIYKNVKIQIKKFRLKELLKLIYSPQFPVSQMQVAIQYSVLQLPERGIDEIIMYTLQFMKYQLENEEIDNINVIIDTIKRLRSRDLTGFLPTKDYENYASQKFWRFFYKNNKALNFHSPVQVTHQEFSWQTLVSYNKIKPGTEIPISMNVDENFICLGLVICENLDNKLLQHVPESTITYSPFSGRVNYCNKITTHQKLKGRLITKITMKILQDKIIWQVCRAHEPNKTIVQTKFEYDSKQTYRFIIKFKRGRISMFK